MRIDIKRVIKIGLIVISLCIPLCFVYPWYVHWVGGKYAQQFSVVLDSHDMEQYDKFFSEDTIFELNGKQIKYIDAKENMQKMQSFTSRGSYGHLDEWFDFEEYIMNNIRKEYNVSLMLPISDYQNGEDIVQVGIIEGEMVLKRKWIFFFDIEKVTFDYDKVGFLEQFLGIEKTDMKEMCVEGFTMIYTPQNRELTADDF